MINKNWSGRPGSNRRRPAWENPPNCPTGPPDRFKALQNTESPRATNRLSREQPYSIQNRERPSAQARTPRGQRSFASSRTGSSQIQLSRKSIPRLLIDYPRRPFSPPNGESSVRLNGWLGSCLICLPRDPSPSALTIALVRLAKLAMQARPLWSHSTVAEFEGTAAILFPLKMAAADGDDI